MQRLQYAIVSVCVLVSGSALAQPLYGLEFSGLTDLFDVNQTNGALTSIGATGLDGLGDMTSDTRQPSFRLWANRIASNELVRLNPATGAVMSTVQMNAPDNIVSIAFDAVTGRLFGNTSPGFGAPFEALYEIDPATGNSTFVGRVLFDNVYALGFDQSGTLFGVADDTNQLISISTTTGNGSLIATLQLGTVFDMASRPTDDVMFVTDSATGRLWTMDTGTGQVFDVGPHVGAVQNNVVGLAFGPIPTPAGVSLLGLAMMGACRRRR